MKTLFYILIAILANPSTGQVISFDVELTQCEGVGSLVELGNMTPLTLGVNTASGATLTDGSQNFVALGVQAGVGCGYAVRNVTQGTFTYVTVVTATTLTLNAAIFIAVNESYEIYTWRTEEYTFDGFVASGLNPLGGLAITQCEIGLADNMYYVAEYEILATNATNTQMNLGGQNLVTGAPGVTIGHHKIAFNPQVWTNDNINYNNLGQTETLDNIEVYLYSTVGIKIFACGDFVTPLLDDSTNSNGWVTYFTGHVNSANDIRAQIDIPWPETGLGPGCYLICVYDLCPLLPIGTQCSLAFFTVNI